MFVWFEYCFILSATGTADSNCLALLYIRQTPLCSHTLARCITRTPWFWVSWLPLPRRRWPMPPASKRPSRGMLEKIYQCSSKIMTTKSRCSCGPTDQDILVGGVSSMKPAPEHRPRHRRNGSCPRIGGPTATLPPTTAREAMEDTEQPHLQPLPAEVEEQSMVAKSVSSSIPTFNSKLLTYAKQRATNMLLRQREAATSVLPPPPRPTAMLPEPPIPIPTAIHAPTTALIANIACNALNRTPYRRSICAPRNATTKPLAGDHTMNRQLGIGIGPRHPPHHPPLKV